MPDQHFDTHTAPEDKDAEIARLRREVQQLAEAWNSVAPDLGQVNGLIQAGWITASKTSRLIPTLIEEIVLLRAERIVPPLNPVLTEVIQGAFGVMSDKLRLSLHQTERTVHQLRYDAFQAAVETVMPTLLSRGRLEGYGMLQGLLTQDIAQTEQVIGYMRDPVHADPAIAMARARNAELHEAQLAVLQRYLNLISQVISGGTTPDQAMQNAATERARRFAAAGVPPGVTVN